MYKTERLEEPSFLRQGEGGEAIEIHGGVGDDKDQTEWILAQDTVQRIFETVCKRSSRQF